MRDRLLALVSQLDGERLDLAEDLLEGIVAQQYDDARSLTVSEVSVLGRLGVSPAALEAPSALPAAARSRIWELQLARRNLSVAEAAVILAVTTARVRQRCAAGTLLAQRRSDGWHVPEFQFPEGRELPGWADVAPVIPAGLPLLLIERVLTSPAPQLVIDGEMVAPFEWLANSGDAALARAAVEDGLQRLP